MQYLSGYTRSIITACLLFLPVAGLFTLPFMIHQYRKYGAVPILRTLVVYSFILYCMCAFLLTVLPLPTRRAVMAMKDHGIEYKLFSCYIETFKKAKFSLEDRSTWTNINNWMRLLRSKGFFEILANIAMQVPLGIYLRYYFRRNWKQTVLIGLCVSLFFELTQLSGLFFIYPKAYRYCSVDDLFNNTLGTLIGFWITPLLCFFLPSREELDRFSIEKGRRVTLFRRVTAAMVDWAIFWVLSQTYCFLTDSSAKFFVALETGGAYLWILLVFVIGERIFKGRTLGMALLRLSVVSTKTNSTPSIWQLLIRYFAIYILFPLAAACMFIGGIGAIMMVTNDSEIIQTGGIVLGSVLLTIGVLCMLKMGRQSEMPHSRWSRTIVIAHPDPKHLPADADTVRE